VFPKLKGIGPQGEFLSPLMHAPTIWRRPSKFVTVAEHGEGKSCVLDQTVLIPMTLCKLYRLFKKCWCEILLL